MNLQHRIELMAGLGDYLKENNAEWKEIKQKAFEKNPWFTLPFIDHVVENIANNYLDRDKLIQWAAHYHIDENIQPKITGIIMAGNIPLVGFHDMLSVFISGHYQRVKWSSKDDVLADHFVKVLCRMDAGISQYISVSEMLKGCDAYIATGSNNSSRYFEYYFGKYPHIIRKNRTSVGILDGMETVEDLEKLSDDIHLYFGLGCRNVTKIYVPDGYDFIPLIGAFNKYKYFSDHHKYKNNYDYQLSILLLNNVKYMTNGSTLLTQHSTVFSPISQLHYEHFIRLDDVEEMVKKNNDIQCIISRNFIPFGEAQRPGLFSYADGVDTMQFLLSF
ncbi:MAG TPA: acyl-CoA reductase [Ferruginibacter sp.]|nr:acyl-CoA reductase [Ferruginibacter sp.]